MCIKAKKANKQNADTVYNSADYSLTLCAKRNILLKEKANRKAKRKRGYMGMMTKYNILNKMWQ